MPIGSSTHLFGDVGQVHQHRDRLRRGCWGPATMDTASSCGDAGGMTDTVEKRPHRVTETRRTGRTPAMALFWRLFFFDALVFVAAAAVLVISPATVSAPVSVTELCVLAVGSALMLIVNGLRLRANLRPLDGLTAPMERVDLLRPGERLSVPDRFAW